jgi:uncharacterized protein (DUF927 family)
MDNRDTSISEYRKYMLLKDSIAEIFKTYVVGYGLADKLDNEVIEQLGDRFEKEYKSYVMDTFIELDIKTEEHNGKNFLVVEELMTKVAGVIASKLAAEILMIELVNRFVHKT